MKTIIKYELVINEALRSALNYDTPDEQINEFIRFFGKHIGSDRIYIFEDCDEKHVTKNTYEWCADGIVPEIHELLCIRMFLHKLKGNHGFAGAGWVNDCGFAYFVKHVISSGVCSLVVFK